ncbi:4-hydroxy-tetrahydrodipicolinate reductase, partial [Pseudomonas sp. HY2-MNA-CIBAN-0224]
QQVKNQAIKVGVIGAGGRMGRMLIEAVQDNSQTALNAAIERQGSSLVGADAGEVAAIGRLDVQIVDDLKTVINDIDVLIDFSLPDATEQNMQICAAHKVAMVIGTTGFNEQQEKVLAKASEQVAIVYAGNYSTGVNLSLKLLGMA